MPQLSRNENTRQPHHLDGFTLIELLVAMIIIGILAAVAYPAYTSQIVKSNRAATQTYMLDLAQREQQYLADSRSYAGTVAQLNLPTPDAIAAKYTITISTQDGPPPTFTITATPVTGTNQAADGQLTIDNTGAKSPSGKW
ncbi:type IV pilin protein [Rugamonas apoptosis]|uniref:Type IV pilin protein n=1 Tax=Rugamonas apoptosis TaxID=2758570 RepID=A0A7W2FFL8_9BURK|nr:type IV pilin protein [Rugamonas apoptosis]MBA5690699.1 type IV pilin protein [Rugamonas apoptosis]